MNLSRPRPAHSAARDRAYGQYYLRTGAARVVLPIQRAGNPPQPTAEARRRRYQIALGRMGYDPAEFARRVALGERVQRAIADRSFAASADPAAPRPPQHCRQPAQRPEPTGRGHRPIRHREPAAMSEHASTYIAVQTALLQSAEQELTAHTVQPDPYVRITAPSHAAIAVEIHSNCPPGEPADLAREHQLAPGETIAVPYHEGLLIALRGRNWRHPGT